MQSEVYFARIFGGPYIISSIFSLFRFYFISLRDETFVLNDIMINVKLGS